MRPHQVLGCASQTAASIEDVVQHWGRLGQDRGRRQLGGCKRRGSLATFQRRRALALLGNTVPNKSTNKGSAPAKNEVGVRAPDRQREGVQEKLVSSAEKIRQALGKRAETL